MPGGHKRAKISKQVTQNDTTELLREKREDTENNVYLIKKSLQDYFHHLKPLLLKQTIALFLYYSRHS